MSDKVYLSYTNTKTACSAENDWDGMESIKPRSNGDRVQTSADLMTCYVTLQIQKILIRGLPKRHAHTILY